MGRASRSTTSDNVLPAPSILTARGASLVAHTHHGLHLGRDPGASGCLARRRSTLAREPSQPLFQSGEDFMARRARYPIAASGAMLRRYRLHAPAARVVRVHRAERAKRHPAPIRGLCRLLDASNAASTSSGSQDTRITLLLAPDEEADPLSRHNADGQRHTDHDPGLAAARNIQAACGLTLHPRTSAATRSSDAAPGVLSTAGPQTKGKRPFAPRDGNAEACRCFAAARAVRRTASRTATGAKNPAHAADGRPSRPRHVPAEEGIFPARNWTVSGNYC